MRIVAAALFTIGVVLAPGCKKPNHAPDTPAVPSGPTSCAVGVEYTFSSSAEDSTGEDVAIRFDWGDGDTSQWSTWVRPGDTMTMGHSWTVPGTCDVRVQARARSSATSDWSGAIAVGRYHEWIRVYGGALEDEGWSVQQTQDGGYIVTGSNRSYGAGESDVWLLKVDADGDTAWTRTFGGAHYDWGKSIQQTRDGGYIIAGGTCSHSGNFPDVLLIKTDDAGNQDWERVFGGNEYDQGFSVQQTEDGGYVAAGYNRSSGAGGIWLLKTDAYGDTVWTRTFGQRGSEGRSVRQTWDGGYVFAALPSFDSDSAIWLAKTDASGGMSWTRAFGSWANEYSGMSVQQTQDGGYVVVGTTCSDREGPGDVLLVKTDSLGEDIWVRTFGGERDDWGNSVQQTRDGGYIVVGNTSSYIAAGFDVWLIKTDANGDTVWTRTFGVGHDDMGYSVQQTRDGGYVVTGSTESHEDDFTDLLLIKTDPEGRVDEGGGK